MSLAAVTACECLLDFVLSLHTLVMIQDGSVDGHRALGVPGADVGVVLSDPQLSAGLTYMGQGTRTPKHVHHISCVEQFTKLNRLNNNNHRQVHTLGCPSPGPSWGGGFGAVAASFWGM